MTTLREITAYPRASVQAAEREGAIRLPFDLQVSPAAILALGAVLAAAVGAGTAIRPVVGVGVLLAGAVAGCILAAPSFGLALLVGLGPITAGLRRGFPVPGFRLSEVIIVGVSVLLLAMARPTDRRRWTMLDWAALAYVAATFGIGVLHIVSRGLPFSGTYLGDLLGPLQFFLLYRAVLTTAQDEATRARCIKIVLFASVAVSLLALAQQFGGSGIRSQIANWTGVNYLDMPAGERLRATGPFPHWHNLGGYLMVIVLLCVAHLARPLPGLPRRGITLAVLGLAVAALLETASVAPILGAVTGAVIIGGLARRGSSVVVGLGIAAVVGAILFGSIFQSRYDQQFSRNVTSSGPAFVPETLQFRWESWTQRQLPVLEHRWIAGWGPDQPPELKDFPYNESLYFSLLLRGGLLLLGAYVVLTAAMLARSRLASHAPDDPAGQLVGRVLFAAFVVFVPMNAIESYFIGSGPPHVLWLLLGVMCAQRAVAPARAEPARLARPARAAAAVG